MLFAHLTDPAAAGVQLMSQLADLSFGQRQVALKALQQRKREARVRGAAALRGGAKTAMQAGLVEPDRAGGWKYMN